MEKMIEPMGGGQEIALPQTITSQQIYLQPGQTLLDYGQDVPMAYKVLSGVLKISVIRTSNRGRTASKEYITQLANAGSFVGIKACYFMAPSGEKITAASAVTLVAIPREVLIQDFQFGGGQSEKIFQSLLGQISSFENTLEMQYLASVQERIAMTLWQLARNFGVSTDRGIKIGLRLTRAEIAQLAGTINESLARHLTELSEKQIVELIGRDIYVKDMGRLKEKSGN